jgi:hypothetical protein
MKAAFDLAREQGGHPPGSRAIPAGLRRRLAERAGRRRFVFWTAVVGLVPAAAVFVAMLGRPHAVPRLAADEPEVTEKGGLAFWLVARRAERVFLVGPRDRLRSGDQIRFVFEHVHLRYLLIASVDGAGEPSIYFPYDGASSVEVSPGDRLEVPGSIIVDEQAGPERLFALFSRRPIGADRVRAALRALGGRGASAVRATKALDIDADEQVTLLIEK